jgi:hypothetical protein
VFEAVVEEGDVMYNPPYWLHAVGTPSGLTISVANRMWQDFFVQRDPTTYHWDALYKLGFPAFFAELMIVRLKKIWHGGADPDKTNSQSFSDRHPNTEPPRGVMHIVD